MDRRATGGGCAREVAIVPVRGALVASDRLDARSPGAVYSPDLSAWNVAASLPSRPRALLDVGTGAGAVALVAARDGGARGRDGRRSPRARVRARQRGAERRHPELDRGGSLRGRRGDAFDVAVFNAPLARARRGDRRRGAALRARARRRAAGGVVPRRGARARAPGRRGAVPRPAHRRRPPSRRASRARLEIAFADAPDGTPHALARARRGAPASVRARVPLGPACPHLARPRSSSGCAPPSSSSPAGRGASRPSLRPAPWLTLARDRGPRRRGLPLARGALRRRSRSTRRSWRCSRRATGGRSARSRATARGARGCARWSRAGCWWCDLVLK